MTDDTDSPMFADEGAASALQVFASAGWPANHLARPDGQLECGDCSSTFAADGVRVEAQHRIEGGSDPDDLQLVVGFSCLECDSPGSIVVGYGPMASEQDSAIVAVLVFDDAGDPVASA